MADTPISLLERLRARPDELSWRRLVDLYQPLIQRWIARQDVEAGDAEDLTQDVMEAMIRDLPRFEHNGRPGAFRLWLRTITFNRLQGYWRARESRPLATGSPDVDRRLAELEDPNSALSQAWDLEHDRHVAHRLVELICDDFEPTTWEAFRRQVMDGEKAAAVAAALGISVNAVLLAKSRVLRRLRAEMRGLTD